MEFILPALSIESEVFNKQQLLLFNFSGLTMMFTDIDSDTKLTVLMNSALILLGPPELSYKKHIMFTSFRADCQHPKAGAFLALTHPGGETKQIFKLFGPSL